MIPGVAGKGAAATNFFPPAPSGPAGGNPFSTFMSSPIGNMLTGGGKAPEMAGTTAKSPGIIGTLKAQAQWNADRYAKMSPAERRTADIFSGMASSGMNSPAPQTGPVAFQGGPAPGSLTEYIQMLLSNRRMG